MMANCFTWNKWPSVLSDCYFCLHIMESKLGYIFYIRLTQCITIFIIHHYLSFFYIYLDIKCSVGPLVLYYNSFPNVFMFFGSIFITLSSWENIKIANPWVQGACARVPHDGETFVTPVNPMGARCLAVGVACDSEHHMARAEPAVLSLQEDGRSSPNSRRSWRGGGKGGGLLCFRWN